MITQYKLDTSKASKAKITYPRLNPTFHTLKPQLAITGHVLRTMPIVKPIIVRRQYNESIVPVRYLQVVTMAMLVLALAIQ